MRKYELTSQTLAFRGRILHQIRAVRDFGNIKAGALGGWIEREDNLSQEGNAWVHLSSHVAENAVISENAQIGAEATILGNAQISGNAKVHLYALVDGNAKIYDNASVCLLSHVTENAEIFGDTEVCYADFIGGQAKILGTAHVFGAARIEQNAFIQRSADILIASGFDDRGSSATFYVCQDNRIRVSMGGTSFRSLDEFHAYADATYGESFRAKVCHMLAQTAREQIAGAYLAAKQ